MLKVTIDITGDDAERALDMLGALLEEEDEEIVGRIGDKGPQGEPGVSLDDDITPVTLDDLMGYLKHKHCCCGKCHKHDN